MELLKVTHGAVFVAEQYLGWQEATLRALQGRFDAEKRGFADDVFVAVVDAVRASGAADGLADKALKQLVMPFAKFKMEEAAAAGAQARVCLAWGGAGSAEDGRCRRRCRCLPGAAAGGAAGLDGAATGEELVPRPRARPPRSPCPARASLLTRRRSPPSPLPRPQTHPPKKRRRWTCGCPSTRRRCWATTWSTSRAA